MSLANLKTLREIMKKWIINHINITAVVMAVVMSPVPGTVAAPAGICTFQGVLCGIEARGDFEQRLLWSRVKSLTTTENVWSYVELEG